MGIRLANVVGNLGAPDVAYSPIGNSVTLKAGDLLGLTTAGLVGRLNNHSSGTVVSSAGGVWGISVDDVTSDGSGNIITPSAPTGVDPGVPAVLAIPSYGRRVTPAFPIAGVRRGQVRLYKATNRNFFIQRHKAGTRVNGSLSGLKCDLTWNDTTLEWEVDSTSTSVGSIVIAPANMQLPWYYDNKTLYDSATYATDASGAWVVFQIAAAADAEDNGLRYSSITS